MVQKMTASGWRVGGLFGTTWAMFGPIYPRAFQKHGLTICRPRENRQAQVHRVIFDELLRGVFPSSTVETFVETSRDLGANWVRPARIVWSSVARRFR